MKKSGAISGDLLLFATSMNEPLADRWVIHDFAKFADIGKSQDVERDFPSGSATGPAKASRGGSWWAGPRGARPANRYRDMPHNGNDDLGFRLALVSAR